MRYFMLVSVLPLFFIHQSMASELKPQDFAEGIVLECPDESTVCRFTLPDDVYETLVRSDFGDMCLFNGKGHVIPHTIQHRDQGVVSRKQNLPPVELPVFPIYKNQTDDSGVKGSWSIVADSHGALINLEAARNNHVAGSLKNVKPLYYIVDASSLKTMPGRLSFLWNGSENYVIHLNISGSDDLNTWFKMVDSAGLADIRMGKSELKQKDVTLLPHSFKYLRVSGKTEADRIVIDQITAHFEMDYIEEAPRKWVRLQRSTDTDNSEGRVFRMNGYRPVDRLRFIFAEKNTLIHAEIFSRGPMDKSWFKVHQGLLYHLDVKGSDIENSIVTFGPVSHSLFKIKVDDGRSGIEDSLAVEAGFIPHTLLFMAQGDGPYILAYGRGNTGEGGQAENGLNDLLMSVDDDKERALIKEARFVEKKILGGPDQLNKQKRKPPLKQVVLWIVLVSAVVLCGYMAFSLYRQMKNGREDFDPQR